MVVVEMDQKATKAATKERIEPFEGLHNMTYFAHHT
jgi:hypothetical protein